MSETKRITLYAAVHPLCRGGRPTFQFTAPSHNQQDSSFPHRVRLALEEAKATHDIIWIDQVEKPEWYEKKVYPGEGRVPLSVPHTTTESALTHGSRPGPVPRLRRAQAQPQRSPVRQRGRDPRLVRRPQFVADLFPAPRLLPLDSVQHAQARLSTEFVDKKFVVACLFMGAPIGGIFAVLDEIKCKLPPTGFVLGD